MLNKLSFGHVNIKVNQNPNTDSTKNFRKLQDKLDQVYPEYSCHRFDPSGYNDGFKYYGLESNNPDINEKKKFDSIVGLAAAALGLDPAIWAKRGEYVPIHQVALDSLDKLA